jgi:hypothetical protein
LAAAVREVAAVGDSMDLPFVRYPALPFLPQGL